MKRERHSRGCAGCSPLCCSECYYDTGRKTFQVQKDDICACFVIKVALVSAALAAFTMMACCAVPFGSLCSSRRVVFEYY